MIRKNDNTADEKEMSTTQQIRVRGQKEVAFFRQLKRSGECQESLGSNMLIKRMNGELMQTQARCGSLVPALTCS
jgi:hypothetical protein